MGNQSQKKTRASAEKVASSPPTSYKEQYDAIPKYEAKQASDSFVSQQMRDRRRRKQAESVRTQNEKDRVQRLRLQLKGIDPDKRKPTIWQKMAEDRLYQQLHLTGFSYEEIDDYQKKRVMWLVALSFLGVMLSLFVHPWLFVGGLISGVGKYMMDMRKADAYFRSWRFARQLSFSKFTRLVIPYLKASNGKSSLYGVFSKIVNRLENEDDRVFLERLMFEMNDNPHNIQPFLDYAERTSGTDMSYLFMSTVFDYQQSTSDVSVIDELGKLASEDMMYAVDEIIDFKINRFELFPTKVVMSSFILVVGVAAGIMLQSFQDFSGSSGGGLLDGGVSPSLEDNPLAQQGENWIKGDDEP